MDPQPSPTQEIVIAQWEQPARNGLLSSKSGASRLWIIALIIAILLGAVAYWQRELNYALTGVIILVAVVALQAQHRTKHLSIAVTNLRIVIGKREHAIAELAGFWLADLGDVVEVNLEAQKPGLVPITFLYGSPTSSEAREVMGQVLPELEPREKKFGDKISDYFKL